MLDFTFLVTMVVLGVIFQIIYKRNKANKFKLMTIFGGIGSCIGLIEVGVFKHASLLVTIIMGLAGLILGGLWPLGFWLMRNDARTKVGLMKESQKRSEEQQMRKEMSQMLNMDNKDKNIKGDSHKSD